MASKKKPNKQPGGVGKKKASPGPAVAKATKKGGTHFDVFVSTADPVVTEVDVNSSSGPLPPWSDAQVHPGPQGADVPSGEVWTVDFYHRFANAGSVTDTVVIQRPGAPERTQSQTIQGNAGDTLTWQAVVV